MKSLNIKRNNGFTLIELLVVIGIIALLSSIVLSSLTQAKAQADNTKQIADYRAVLNALLQFKQDNGYYPSANTSGDTCIGIYSNGGCKKTSLTIPNDISITTSLQKYLSSHNFTDKSVTITSFPPQINDYKGFVLRCLSGGSQCKNGTLLFPALKNKNSCPQIMSDVKASDGDVTGTQDYTLCSVELN